MSIPSHIGNTDNHLGIMPSESYLINNSFHSQEMNNFVLQLPPQQNENEKDGKKISPQSNNTNNNNNNINTSSCSSPTSPITIITTQYSTNPPTHRTTNDDVMTIFNSKRVWISKVYNKNSIEDLVNQQLYGLESEEELSEENNFQPNERKVVEKNHYNNNNNNNNNNNTEHDLSPHSDDENIDVHYSKRQRLNPLQSMETRSRPSSSSSSSSSPSSPTTSPTIPTANITTTTTTTTSTTTTTYSPIITTPTSSPVKSKQSQFEDMNEWNEGMVLLLDERKEKEEKDSNSQPVPQIKKNQEPSEITTSSLPQTVVVMPSPPTYNSCQFLYPEAPFHNEKVHHITNSYGHASTTTIETNDAKISSQQPQIQQHQETFLKPIIPLDSPESTSFYIPPTSSTIATPSQSPNSSISPILTPINSSDYDDVDDDHVDMFSLDTSTITPPSSITTQIIPAHASVDKVPYCPLSPVQQSEETMIFEMKNHLPHLYPTQQHELTLKDRLARLPLPRNQFFHQQKRLDTHQQQQHHNLASLNRIPQLYLFLHDQFDFNDAINNSLINDNRPDSLTAALATPSCSTQIPDRAINRASLVPYNSVDTPYLFWLAMIGFPLQKNAFYRIETTPLIRCIVENRHDLLKALLSSQYHHANLNIMFNIQPKNRDAGAVMSLMGMREGNGMTSLIETAGCSILMFIVQIDLAKETHKQALIYETQLQQQSSHQLNPHQEDDQYDYLNFHGPHSYLNEHLSRQKRLEKKSREPNHCPDMLVSIIDRYIDDIIGDKLDEIHPPLAMTYYLDDSTNNHFVCDYSKTHAPLPDLRQYFASQAYQQLDAHRKTLDPRLWYLPQFNTRKDFNLEEWFSTTPEEMKEIRLGRLTPAQRRANLQILRARQLALQQNQNVSDNNQMNGQNSNQRNDVNMNDDQFNQVNDITNAGSDVNDNTPIITNDVMIVANQENRDANVAENDQNLVALQTDGNNNNNNNDNNANGTTSSVSGHLRQLRPRGGAFNNHPYDGIHAPLLPSHEYNPHLAQEQHQRLHSQVIRSNNNNSTGNTMTDMTPEQQGHVDRRVLHRQELLVRQQRQLSEQQRQLDQQQQQQVLLQQQRQQRQPQPLRQQHQQLQQSQNYQQQQHQIQLHLQQQILLQQQKHHQQRMMIQQQQIIQRQRNLQFLQQQQQQQQQLIHHHQHYQQQFQHQSHRHR